ncbi:CAP domain-containing protein [Tumebacillus flagellatus]|nr:CAP domain-containing protein [Tumebacillus flagellatus]
MHKRFADMLKSLAALALTTTLLLPSNAVTPAPAHAESSVAYTVKSGDSVWKIATKYQIGVSEIVQANNLKNPSMIYPGQHLIIPQLDPKVTSFQNQVVQLTNAQRAKYGLSPLKMNWELQRMARIKSEDMRNKNYFDHQSPTYGSPFDMMKSFGVTFSYAGENIAAGQQTPQSVVDAWMKSPGHPANILKKEYTQIGCGVAVGGQYGYYWTQEFIRQ